MTRIGSALKPALIPILAVITAFIVGSIFIGLNLLSDLLYNMLDPRTRAMTQAR